MKLLISVIALAAFLPFARAEMLPYQNRNLPVEARIDDLIPRMTLEEKLTMLGGSGFGFGTSGVPRLGIPGLEMADGPQGVRGERSTAFPSSLAMVATWNPRLIRQIGAAIGREVRAEGRNVILAPYPILYRVPQSGRNFECMGEDPYLNSRITEGFIYGTQDEHIISNTKTFLLNNQEINRMAINMTIDERGLRELELPVFEAAIAAGTESIMASYNRVNGIQASENKWLLQDLLKDDLGFRGFVLSDWGAVHSGKAATAGLDMEMPFGVHTIPAMREGVTNGTMPMSNVDEKVRRVLRAIYKIGDMDGLNKGDRRNLNSKENQRVALDSAREAIVLLKNENKTLPLKPRELKKVAVIGPNSIYRRYHGNGSGQVNPLYNVIALDGIKAALGDGVEVNYAQGVKIPDQIEIIEGPMVSSVSRDGRTVPGFREECFGNKELSGAPLYVQTQPDLLFWYYPDPRLVPGQFSCRWTGTLNVPQSGPMHFSFGWTGRNYRLFIDDVLVKDMFYETTNWETEIKLEHLTAGPHKIRIDYKSEIETFMFGFGWQQPEAKIEDAVKLAKESDAAILVVGTSSSFESEGFDRANLTLPGDQDRLIKEVLAVNPRTVVVIMSGAAVLMREWRDQAPAIIHAWFPGQEAGRAIGDILVGKINPSGKLPITLPRREEDSPSTAYYPGDGGESMDYGAVSVFEGYRGYDAKGIEPEFAFGHGLSYTSFRYSNLKVRAAKARALDPRVEVSFTLTNTGARGGAEVAQLYVAEENPALPRPPRELKGFQKVWLRPGESRSITFSLDAKAFRYWDDRTHAWAVSPGAFRVELGSSSRDIRVSDDVLLK